jgi:tellurite resistance protein
MSIKTVPVSYFGVVLGLSGLGAAWRTAHEVWGLPPEIGDVLTWIAFVVWAALVVLYALKWIQAREDAIAELRHPVQCCFAGLLGVSTMLVGLGALHSTRPVAVVLVSLGFFLTAAFALWRTGLLWQGGRDPAANTPILYLPLVAGAFVTATALAGLGHADWAQLAFGAGLFSWLAIESVLLHRLYTAPELAIPLRPALGIQLAPPAVGLIAYVSLSSGPLDGFARGLLGYALLQAAVLVRLLPWILRQPFAPSYWAFTFGATALGTAPLRMMERGETGAVALIAPWTFAGANLVVAATAAGSLVLLARPGIAALARRFDRPWQPKPQPSTSKGE